jgi:4-amino-4-deoxy-L-arabinose transferase-like glycosyltransferase
MDMTIRTVARRLEFWRSPPGQPRWARPAVLVVAAAAALLYGWNIERSGFDVWPSVAAKSMSVSWKAFFYGAVDPGATITMDKLAGASVPQALSARLFGFHPWSLALPQVVEGVISVLAMFRLGRRWLGPAVGLLAATAFALTPLLASMFGHTMEDGLLTMCLVLAADALWTALSTGRLPGLLLAGVWVGVGFQAKMLQAWVVLPALALTYLLAAPVTLGRRVAHVAAAGAVTVAVSLSWIALFAVTPAADRPYVDGSTDNSAFAMVFGYNGLDRFGVDVPGSLHSAFTDVGPAAGAPTGLLGELSAAGSATVGANDVAKLLSVDDATQVGWLYPAALLALVVGLWWSRRAPRTDLIRAGFVLWGLWLTIYAVVFSEMAVPHTAYLASLAPPVSALAAGGLVTFRRELDTPGRAWALPAVVVAQTAWAGYLCSRFPGFLPWLGWTAGAAAILAAAVLTVAALPERLRPTRLRGPAGGRVATAGVSLAVLSVFAVPAAWSVSVLDPVYDGHTFDAAAGPVGAMMWLPPGVGGSLSPATRQRLGERLAGRDLPAGILTGSDTLTPEQQRLDQYLRAHHGGSRFVAATESWSLARPYITATGQPFLPVGGFTGAAPSPTLPGVQRLVATGDVHYFLLDAADAPGQHDTSTDVAGWVRSACVQVPPTAYGDPAAGASTTRLATLLTLVGLGRPALYRCGPP